MAHLLRISNKSRTSYVDLLNGVFGLRNEPPLWPFLEGSDGESIQAETFSLAGRGNPVTILLPAKEDYERLLKQNRLWHNNPLLDESIWIESNLDGELERRCLLYPRSKINHVPGAGVTPYGNISNLMLLSLLLERHPAWEDLTPSTQSGTAISGLGGKLTLTAAGTLESRISKLTIDGISGVAPIGTYWLGIQPYNDGISSFEPLWELEDGGISGYTDVSFVSDVLGSGSGNNVLEISFATDASLLPRHAITVGSVIGSNYEHMRGTYMVLLRYRADNTNAAEFGLQLKVGYGSTPNPAPVRDEIFVPTSDDEFHFVELGEFTIPPGTERGVEGTNIANAQVELYAERLTGTARLRCDCYVMMPSKHMIKLTGGGEASASMRLDVFTHENDKITAIEFDAGVPRRNIVPEPTNWYIPVGETNGGVLVLAMQRATGDQDKDDTADLELEVYNRWLSYRYA
ncbi:MAG: hypothetical protein L0332_06820 [Chloroflexi bacterium]|nr:hypothetical protein [Chloroflexota bacterium]